MGIQAKKKGALPFRLLALKYGADIVYSEELIDRKLVLCTRSENEQQGTVEYKKDGVVVWSTCPSDTPTVIQLGTGSEEYAVKAAQTLNPQDYDALDINMGCPLPFSVQGGMGAALLKDRERIKQVVAGLVRNINKPITCKIRIFENLQDTVDLVKTIRMLGAQAVAVHGRLVTERDKHKAHWDAIKVVKEQFPDYPIIANGDILKHDDIARVREATGCSSVMIARGALWNCSIFSPNHIPALEVATEYLQNCQKYTCPFSFIKYTTLRMFEETHSKTEFFQTLTQKTKSIEDLLDVLHAEIAREEAASQMDSSDVDSREC